LVKPSFIELKSIPNPLLGKFEPHRARIFEYLKEQCAVVAENKNRQWDSHHRHPDDGSTLRPYLLLMVGPPASGKSTFVKEYIENNQPNDIAVLSRDHIRAIFPPEYAEDKPNIEQEMMVTEIFNAALTAAARRKMNIVIDNTNVRKSYIEQIVQAVGYEDVRFKVMDADLLTCLERNRLRSVEKVTYSSETRNQVASKNL
jgi:predicted kinase